VPCLCHRLATLLSCSTAHKLQLVLNINLHTCRQVNACPQAWSAQGPEAKNVGLGRPR
jgi:hypothetical protein